MTRPGAPRTQLVDGPDGPLEILRTGRGEPHTVFAHGLGGSIRTTRPYATKVAGTRTFLHFRGHGASVVPSGTWGYAELARELWWVADGAGGPRADRALGTSMGAGAICRGLTQDPDRLQRVVLVVPAALDEVRDDPGMGRFAALADDLEAGDEEAVVEQLLTEQPRAARSDPAARRWCQEQAQDLVACAPGLAAAMRQVPVDRPVIDRDDLARVTCPVLILAQEDDPTHPVSVASELAEVLPGATLHVAGPGGLIWEHRDETRDLVGQFLSEP